MALSVNVKNAAGFAPILSENELKAAHDTLVNQTGRGADFLGWVRLPLRQNEDELAKIEAAAAKIRANSQVLVVVGIGGSYLGARAAIEFVRSPNYNLIVKDSPQVIFAGNTLSADQTAEIFALLEGKEVSVNVISKSGTTTEPAVAFRLFRAYMENRYGIDGARERIYATTDKARGALKTLADENGYPCFVIPDDVGGRFSVLTPVGLLPIAVAGIDIRAMLAGAASMAERLLADASLQNPAWQYAATRNALYRKGYTTEVFASYEPRVRYTAEWWKQLYGESEGKEGKGIFPASVELTADLHSMGQYIQEGERRLMETVVGFAEKSEEPVVPFAPKNEDGLNFLSGLPLSRLNDMAKAGTILAHVDGGVPVMEITLDNASAEAFGGLVYFFEFACGLSGYLLGVNPFDQPGVEEYKQNMYALIGKPGFEARKAELEKRL